ncbi:MAG: BNR-4 repeat-containing protein, partial [Janthinobacterium lividum]
ALLEPQAELTLGPAWAGNSVNCVPYRHAPLVCAGNGELASYYDPDGQVVIASIDGSRVRHIRIPNLRMPFDAHQAISLGVDPAGHIHVAFGAHNSSILIARSRTTLPQDGFVPPMELVHGLDEFDGSSSSASLTYPMFLRTRSDLLLLYRRGAHSDGALHISRLDADGSGWMPDATPIVSGRSCSPRCGPYLNTPVVLGGDTIACFLVWRLPSGATGAGAVVNVGIDGFLSSDGMRTLSSMRGVDLGRPITPVTVDRIVALGPGAGLINQAGSAARPDGTAAVISYWDPLCGVGGDAVPQYRMAWWTSSGWRVAQVSAFHTPFRLDGGGTLPLPHSRPELLFDDDARAYVIWRSREQDNRLMLRVLQPPDYLLEDSVELVLVDENLGFYEPVINRDAWERHRRLSIYVQWCAQNRDRDGKPDRAVGEARLMSWTLVHSVRNPPGTGKHYASSDRSRSDAPGLRGG